MTRKEHIEDLRDKAVIAHSAYMNAVTASLMNIGTEVPLVHSYEGINGILISSKDGEADDTPTIYCIDKIRFNKETHNVEVHVYEQTNVTEPCNGEVDRWDNIYDFESASFDYIFSNIDWDAVEEK
jgi:hypothetical protein